MNEIIEIKQKGWKSNTLRVDLILGNICNYKCWYCWPQCNRGDVKWPEFDLVTQNLSCLLDYYLKNSNKR
jgi:wyosine [tRNA(Phe)-imidazoG37] synthetase (radical SAM superfamily)